MKEKGNEYTQKKNEMNILIFHWKYNTTFPYEIISNHQMNDQEKIIKEK